MGGTRKRKRSQIANDVPPAQQGKFTTEELELRKALYLWIRKMRQENPHEPLVLAAAKEEKSPGEVGYATSSVLKEGLTLEEWVMDKMGDEIELGLDEKDQVVVCAMHGENMDGDEGQQ